VHEVQTFNPLNFSNSIQGFANAKGIMKIPRFLAAATLGLTFLTWSRAPAADATNQAVCMVIVGDSTVCNWPEKDPRRGWGMFIQGYFNNQFSVTNLAKSGRSTKTFITEGLWARALKAQPGYVLIQFGHNDSHAPDKPEATDAKTTYKDYLRQYIDDSRAIGARPVLITPMCRRTFGADEKLKDALLPYANAMKEVAVEKRVPLVDLHAASARLFEQLGPTGSNALANEPGDATHFNDKGARAMADLVAQELPVVEPSLKKYLK
jgi:lysophospholipase L1-like esterase